MTKRLFKVHGCDSSGKAHDVHVCWQFWHNWVSFGTAYPPFTVPVRVVLTVGKRKNSFDKGEKNHRISGQICYISNDEQI